jgi:hypothetical protein
MTLTLGKNPKALVCPHRFRYVFGLVRYSHGASFRGFSSKSPC